MSSGGLKASVSWVFQSAPAPEGAGDALALTGALAVDVFQSAPAPEGAGDAEPYGEIVATLAVSIRAGPRRSRRCRT